MTMTQEFLISKITDEDSPYFRQLAELHQQEIPDGFLSQLGTRFLTRLYRSLSRSSHSFVIVATREDCVVGFICGATDTKAVYKDFMIHSGLQSLPMLLRRFVTPKYLRRIFETLLYPSKKENKELPAPEILNFCVDKRWQRQGIGKKLFDALVKEFRQLDIPRIKIVTGENQKKAQNFYESLNAVQVAEINVHRGATSFVYTYDVPSSD